MNCCTKESIIDKTSRDTLCHICPSKLSKRELEDLYYALLQNNLELKKKLNRQSDRIKILSTKLQRMSATQRTYVGKDVRDCCAATKNIVEEQKASIEELKRHNDNLREQIKQLTMKLCSTKQFLQGSANNPLHATSRISTQGRSRPDSAAGEGVGVDVKTGAADRKSATASASPTKKSEGIPKPSRYFNKNQYYHNKPEKDVKEIKDKKETKDNETKKGTRELSRDKKKDVQKDPNKKERNETVKKLYGNTPRSARDPLIKIRSSASNLLAKKSSDSNLPKKIGGQQMSSKRLSISCQCIDKECISSSRSLNKETEQLTEENKNAVPEFNNDETEANRKRQSKSQEINRRFTDRTKTTETGKERKVDGDKTKEKSKSPKTKQSKTALDGDQSDAKQNNLSKNKQSKKAQNVDQANAAQNNLERTSLTKDVPETDSKLDNTSPKLCNENRCRTMMEELKQKISQLENDLAKTHEEYSSRITALEEEISKLREENIRLRSEREHSSQRHESEVKELRNKLRDTQLQCGDMSTQLQLEQNRVAELEAQVKTAEIASKVARALEERLQKVMDDTKLQPVSDNVRRLNEDVILDNTRDEIRPYPERRDSMSSPVDWNEKPTKESPVVIQPETPTSTFYGIKSEDSGYTDQNKSRVSEDDEKASLLKANEELKQLITQLQSQLEKNKDSEPAPTADETVVDAEQPSRFANYRPSLPAPRITESFHDLTTQVRNSEDRERRRQAKEEGKGRHLDDANRRWISYDDAAPTAESVPAPDIETTLQSFAEKSDAVTDQDDKKCSHNVKCLCKKYCQDASPKDDDKQTEKPTDDSAQRIPEMFTSGTDWDMNTARVDPKQNSEESLNKGRKKTSSSQRNKSTDQRHSISKVASFVHKESIFLPSSSGRDLKNKDDKSETPKPQQQYITSTPRTMADRAKGSFSADKDRILSVNLQNRGSRAERSKYLLQPTESEEYVSAPFLPDAFFEQEGRSSLPGTPPSTPEAGPSQTQRPVMVDKFTLDQYDLCSEYVQVCRCETTPRREVAVFRSCSGTLKFRTIDTDAIKVRHCRCTTQRNFEPVLPMTCALVQENDHRSSIGGAGALEKTYNVNENDNQRSRTTTPENTDKEISYMSDLPSEKGPACVECVERGCSLGEDKQTTTYTDSYTTPTAEVGTLSEGELPQRSRSVSTASKQTRNASVDAKSEAAESVASAKMEQALSAINEELTRCRLLLLQSTVPQEKPKRDSTDASVNTEDSSRNQNAPISLRKTEGKSQISDTFSPRCLFTMHIGTVVLSDEAVINSRDLQLMLTWKFFDQNVAMTRMRAGRVMHFDFSTEYDVKLTDEFLDYMKYEEMPIKICEVNKPDVPFASCALPLRDALLHTNRRADMSLALTAGPGMTWRRKMSSADVLDAGDEVGVLDMWCVMRAEPRILPIINKAIAKPSTLWPTGTQSTRPSSSGPIMAQLNEDDTDEFRLSADLNPYDSGSKNRFNEKKDISSELKMEPSTVQDHNPKYNYGYRDSASFPVYTPSSLNDPTTAPISTMGPDAIGTASIGTGSLGFGSVGRSSIANSEGTTLTLPYLTARRSSLAPTPLTPRHRTDSSGFEPGIPTQVSYDGRWKNLSSPNIRASEAMKKAVEGQNATKALNEYIDNNKRTSFSNPSDSIPTRDTNQEELCKKYDAVGKMMSAKRAYEAFKKVTINNKKNTTSEQTLEEPVNKQGPDSTKFQPA